MDDHTAFRCRSGMFFYNSESQNCILNSQTGRMFLFLFVIIVITGEEAEHLFSPSGDDLVDYFELKCDNGNEALTTARK
jgi:hypothetical protein